MFVYIFVFIILMVFMFLLRDKLITKISFRNIFKKKMQTVLILLGTMIGTAFIIGALGINDTYNNFVNTNIEKFYYKIDAVLDVDGLEQEKIDEALNKVKNNVDEQSILPVYYKMYPVLKEGQIQELNFSDITNVGIVGFSYEKYKNSSFYEDIYNEPLGPNETIITQDLADDLNVEVGDVIQILDSANVSTILFPNKYKIKDIINSKGLLNYRGSNSESQQGAVFLNERKAANLLKATGSKPNQYLINFGQVDDYDQIMKEFKTLEKEISEDMQLIFPKERQEEMLSSGEISAIFLALSSFSFLAGGILMVSIYSMLMNQRRKEMGVLRAIGFKKDKIRKMIFFEGIFYNLFSVPLGLISGYLLSRFTFEQISDFSESLSNFEMFAYFPQINEFFVRTESFIIAGVAGFLIPTIFIYFYSYKVSKMNIVNAIKGIKEKSKPRSLIYFTGYVVISFLLSWYSGFNNALIYFLISAFGLLTPLIFKKLMNRRLLINLIYFIVFGLSIWIPSEDYIFIGAKSFVMIISSVVIFLYDFDFIILGLKKILNLFNVNKAVVNISTSYPSKKKNDVSLIIVLYSIVLFLIVISTIIPDIQRNQIKSSREELFAGFDGAIINIPVPLISSKTDKEQVKEIKYVEEAANFYYVPSTIVGGDNEYFPLMIGSNEFFEVNNIKIKDKMDSFEDLSDKEVWQEIRNNPEYIAFPESINNRLKDKVEVGQEISIGKLEGSFNMAERPDFSDNIEMEVKFTVAAIIPEVINTITMGPIVSNKFEEFNEFSKGSFNGQIFTLDENYDRDELEGVFKKNKYFFILADDLVNFGLNATEGIFSIINSFLYFGLIVGVVGLAITFIKSIDLRTKTIGMLKAIGFKNKMVFKSFFIEYSIIIFLAIFAGYLSGIIGSYNIYTVFIGEATEFAIPWVKLLYIAVALYAVSIFSIVLPLYKTTKIQAAESMRVED
ncbi:MAG: ABC transporter permease [Thermotogota bacterium]